MIQMELKGRVAVETQPPPDDLEHLQADLERRTELCGP